MKTIKELEVEEKEAMKGCGENPVDEDEGMVLSFNNGTASISGCGNNNEYCPMCSVKINGIIQSIKTLKDVIKLIGELNHYTDYGGKPNNYIKTKEFKARIEGK